MRLIVIKAMHYFAACFLILGHLYDIQLFHSIAVGIIGGIGIGCWWEYHDEQKRIDREIEDNEKYFESKRKEAEEINALKDKEKNETV